MKLGAAMSAFTRFMVKLPGDSSQSRMRSTSQTLTLVCLSLLMTQSAKAQEPVGYVVDMQGEWRLDGRSSNLAKLNVIPGGKTVRFLKPAIGKNYIFIADQNGKISWQRECFDSNLDECNKPILLPVAQRTSLVSRLVRAVMNFWSKDPETYEALNSRGSESLHESVVKLTDKGVDLSLAFRDKGRDLYQLRFAYRGRGSVKEVATVVFDWNPAVPSLLLVPGMKPGLYKIELLDMQNQQLLGAGEDVWVLVRTPGKGYDQALADFQKVESHISHWTAEGLDESKRSFLRAYLDYLVKHEKR
jgi:hypothetical protein